MTRNQISFAQLNEDIRHHKQEESLGIGTLAESVRHNVSTEGIQRYSAQENARHNVRTEQINWYSAQNLAQLQHAQAYNQYEAGKTQSTQRDVNSALASKYSEEVQKMYDEREQIQADIARIGEQADYYHNLAELEHAKLDDQMQQANYTIARAELAGAQADEARARADAAIEAAHAQTRSAKAAEKNAEINERNARTRENELKESYFRDIVGFITGNNKNAIDAGKAVLPLIAMGG